MNNSYNALRNITSFRNTGKSQPISGIELMVTDDEAVNIVKNIAYTVLNADMDGYWYSLKIIINSVCDFIVK